MKTMWAFITEEAASRQSAGAAALICVPGCPIPPGGLSNITSYTKNKSSYYHWAHAMFYALLRRIIATIPLLRYELVS